MPNDRVPVLNRSAIEFPSDRITIGEIRARQPEFFTGHLSKHQLLDLVPMCMVDLENVLAERAFAATLRAPDPHQQDSDSRQLAHDLDSYYREWGISNGPEQSKELIRRFQQAAVSQAKAIRGISR